jgi:uncharacterized protein YggU (UPF0235/DUF167 family)
MATTLAVRVQPGARQDGWAGTMPDGRRKVRVAAPPIEGRANDAVTRFVARSLGLAARAVRVAHGTGARDKVLEIDLDADELRARLARVDRDEDAGEDRGKAR